MAKLTEAELAAELEIRKCKRDARYFIENYVHIEDRDAPILAVLFKLWSKQVEVLATFLVSRLSIILKARQLGLTWLALAYATWCMVFRPGFAVVALSKREDPDAKELIRRMVFVLRHLPKWMVREKKTAGKVFAGPQWESTALTVTINHPGGEPSVFQSMSAAPDSGRSFTANLVLLDEWAFQEYADEIWSAAYPTINRPTGGQVIGLSTGKRGTLFEDKWNNAEREGFAAIFLPWHADPRRTPEWYVATKKALPNTYRAEYPSTPEEAFAVGEGAFFEEWDTSVHILRDWHPPKNWRRFRAYDPGFSTYACCKWYAVAPDGWIICYREYYPHRTTDIDQVKEIKRLSIYEDGKPEKIEYTVADTNAWVPSRDSGQSTAEIFARNGVPLRRATKDLENGWRRLHEWLKPFDGSDGEPMALLRFTRNCINSIATYPSCEMSKTNPEDISESSEHHAQDCDRYAVMSRPRPYVDDALRFPGNMSEAEKAAVRTNLEFDRFYRTLREKNDQR